MLTQRRLLLAALTAAVALGSSSASRALYIDVLATPFTGADTSVHIRLDDKDGGGNIEVTLTVDEGIADLRGFFLDFSDFSLLDGLSVTGADVTGFTLDEDNVINLHYGVNMNGGGSPCPCDLGVLLGTPGTGRDDIFTTTFVLDAATDLVLESFAGQLIGVRVTSVGGVDDFASSSDLEDPRDGSAKLVATIPDPIVPVPEPSTALLFALGLGALTYAGRRPSSASTGPGRRPGSASAP